MFHVLVQWKPQGWLKVMAHVTLPYPITVRKSLKLTEPLVGHLRKVLLSPPLEGCMVDGSSLILCGERKCDYINCVTVP